MKIPHAGVGIVIGIGLMGCVGCSSAAKKPVYSAPQTGQIIREERGEIIAVRDVVIEPPDGSVLRGGTGRQVGSAVGRAAVTGSVIGAAAAIGGIVGGELGSKADTKAGEEITIRLAGSEEIITVVQERGDVPLAVGERVRVQIPGGGGRNPMATLGGGGVRVIRDEYRFAEADLSEAADRRGRSAGRFVNR